jgi:hypothetical protein
MTEKKKGGKSLPPAQTVDLDALSQPERRAALDALGLHKVPAAPSPIKPLTGSSRAAELSAMSVPSASGSSARSFLRPSNKPTDYPRANWNLWRKRKHIELWQGVCLTLNVEPLQAITDAAQWPEWLKDRLSFLQPVLLDGDVFSETIGGYDWRCMVRMSEFAALAAELWRDEVPAELKALAPLQQEQPADPSAHLKASQPNPLDPSSSVPQAGVVPRRKRKDLLAALIEKEQRKFREAGGDPMDPHEMFARLAELAQQPKPPIPITEFAEGEIKWDKGGQTQFLDLAALRRRLKSVG